jgi:CubicO group peptidase (beta-lactamase class C family)
MSFGSIIAAALAGVMGSVPSNGPKTEQLEAAWQYSLQHQGQAMLVRAGGKTLFEKYANGGGPSQSFRVYSGTKGLWALAFLAAEQDGWLDLDHKAARYLPEWRRDPVRAEITLRQLLNFTSGLSPEFSLHREDWKSRDAHAIQAPLVAPPGRTFVYGPASLQAAHACFRQALGNRESPTHYLERRILSPLGLGPQRYLADKAGNPLLATGMRLTARQWAQVGELILSNGKAPDGSTILAPAQLSQAFRSTALNPAFGMGFWTNARIANGDAREVDPEETLELDWDQQNWTDACLSTNAPSDLVVSLGSGGQRLYVIPSRQLLIIRQGPISKFADAPFLGRLFGP